MGDSRLRGDGAADPGRPRRRGLGPIPRRVPDGGGARRMRPRPPCSGPGAASATTGGRWRFGEPRSPSSRSTAGRCRTTSLRSAGCRGSGRTRLGPSPHWPSGGRSAPWTPTFGACSIAPSEAGSTRSGSPSSRRSPTRACPPTAPATGPTRSWTSAPRSAGRGHRAVRPVPRDRWCRAALDGTAEARSRSGRLPGDRTAPAGRRPRDSGLVRIDLALAPRPDPGPPAGRALRCLGPGRWARSGITTAGR